MKRGTFLQGLLFIESARRSLEQLMLRKQQQQRLVLRLLLQHFRYHAHLLSTEYWARSTSASTSSSTKLKKTARTPSCNHIERVQVVFPGLKSKGSA